MFVDTASEMFGIGSTISKQQIIEASQKADVPVAGWFRKKCKVGYNQFKLPTSSEETVPTTIGVINIVLTSNASSVLIS